MLDEYKAPRLTTAEVAAQLGVTRQTVLEMLHEGRLRGYHYPGTTARRGNWRMSQADVDAFLRRAANITEPRA